MEGMNRTARDPFTSRREAAEMAQTMNLLSNISSLQSLLGSLATMAEGLDEVMPIIEGFSKALGYMAFNPRAIIKGKH